MEHGFVRIPDYDYGSVHFVHHKKVYRIRIARLQNGGFWKTKKGSESAVLSPDKIEDVDKLVGKLIELAKVGWPSAESQPLTPELLKHHRTWCKSSMTICPGPRSFSIARPKVSTGSASTAFSRILKMAALSGTCRLFRLSRTEHVSGEYAPRLWKSTCRIGRRVSIRTIYTESQL